MDPPLHNSVSAIARHMHIICALTSHYDERRSTDEVLKAYFRELRSQPSEIDRNRIEQNN